MATRSLMAYHSSHNSDSVQLVCGLPILPIKTSAKGPAPSFDGDEKTDIVGEAITFFRANVLFKNFEFNGPADKLLVYLTLFISQCLQYCDKQMTRTDGAKQLNKLVCEPFKVPGDSTFCLGGMVSPPASASESDLIKQYLRQLREEVSLRLMNYLYPEPEGRLSKWWMSFSKKKFLNKTI
ncbi:Actin-related protein 2/3 complex subunit 3 [Monocercomonoides exilis]|uniref:Actin-related protein 2/3 complex subunit 3 n=1 Tax=Monocercomonoides exilis TaxID=2049356 RepID=UPI003559BDBD|nr:Actin-related protein 2/3 complex subunit 3 [Monocercomonoides exilis]|eukprot:MONOS_9897.1-p1 / transcript=MONOS_9897.1 / gene=MONOS_9897 / organism=Monocercomonoides_exilis_PA203 / gene_product=Actin-related protein 2/3 complex subunit 3 / transcript_product=Actin-related protein 2/3 complex subunit 3 / location=Mono_scaffold00425:31422-32267(-) / protein_length=181 / sequence_SO=supercontig / SO=protein_coding / is_pseudo=false